MSFQERYRAAFSRVRPAGGFCPEEWTARRPRRRGVPRRALVLAAAVALLAALSLTAYATGLFGLRQWLLPEPVAVDMGADRQPEAREAISLSGYMDTPESRALAEWEAFLAGYDRDGAILASVGNAPTGLEEDYGLYNVYTREMADRLDEITARYGLGLHTRMEVVMPSVWSEAVGGFLAPGNAAFSGYIYENGTFALDGEVSLPGLGAVDYQLRRSVRGTFDQVFLTVDSLDRCTEWEYAAGEGPVLTLALWPQRGLVLADLGDCFVTVNVLRGTADGLGAAELEALADSFAFSALSPAEAPDLDAVAALTAAETAALHEQPTLEEDPLYRQTGIDTTSARWFVDRLAMALAEEDREAVAGLLLYPVAARSPAGSRTVQTPREMLDCWEEVFGGGAAAALGEGLRNASLIGHNGLVGAVTVSGGGAWLGLTEGNVITLSTLLTDEGWGVVPLWADVAPAPAAPASPRAAYAAALEDLLYGDLLPDGARCDPYDERELNQFAVCDVDGDGAEELVLLFTNTYTAGMAGYVCAYDEETGALRTQLLEFPMLTFYENGAVTAGWSHNQGRAGDSLWPYTLYRYDAASDRYVQTALVDAWSRAYTEPLGLTEPFPEDIDRSGTGVVYYIYTEDGSAPARTVDAADYAAWRAEELGAGAERALPWQSLTEENIRGLTETP